jgi:hypothetical protein
MIADIIIPNDQTVLYAATLAAAAHLYLIKRKGQTRLSPVVPKGWVKISVSVKQAKP